MRLRTGSVAVEGLNETVKALKEVDEDLPKQLRDVSKTVAGFVADEAKGRGFGLGGVAAKAATSVKPSAGQKFSAVNLGGSAYPFAAGAEFGGGARPTTRQFEPWRGSGATAGYFVYPTIRANEERIERAWLDGLDDILRSAGLSE